MKLLLFCLPIFLANLFAQQNKVPKILFSSKRDTTATEPSIYIMNPDGTNIERFKDSLIGFQPRISRDGKKIAYTGVINDSVLGPPQSHVMNIDGTDDYVVSLCPEFGNWVPCTAYHFNPAFSPDGKFVAYYDEDGWTDSDIYVVSSDTINGFYKKVLTNPVTNEIFYDWSPVEDKLLFKSYYFNDTIDYDGELFSMDSNGENWVRLTYDNLISGNARYSPDGERIAYINHLGGNNWEIYLMNKDGENKIQLTSNEIDEGFYGLSWVPNGQSILFGADDQIFSIEIQSGNIMQITNDEYYNRYPEWIEIDLTDITEEITEPIEFNLFSIYPNPFNSSVIIEYSINEDNKVFIEVFDILGKKITELVNTKQKAGKYSVDFNADKHNLSSGIYFCSLIVGNQKRTLQKMILLK